MNSFTFVDAVKSEKKGFKEELWLEVREQAVLGQKDWLSLCLVGGWAEDGGFDLDVEAVKDWGINL